jgi:two-component sensor histidine kinase
VALFKQFLFFIFLSLTFSSFGQKLETILNLERDLKDRMPENIRVTYLYSLANLYSDVDSLKFLEYLNEGINLSLKTNNIAGLGDYYNIASVKSLGDRNFKASILESEKAAHYFLKSKDTASHLNSVYIMIRASYESGKYEKIQEYASKGLDLVKDQNYAVQRGKIYSILAVYYRKTNIIKAKLTFEKAINCFKVSKDYKWLIMPYIALSSIYSILGKNDSAIYCTKRAIGFGQLAVPFQDVEFFQAKMRLAYLLETSGNQAQAISELEKLSIASIKLKSKLNQVQGKYTQISLLKIKQAQQKLNNTLLVIGLCLIILLSITFFVINIQSRKRQEQLTFMNQELEFSSYQNQILLKETNHRVKNNFQMIIGLLNLHANSPESNHKNFVQLSISRITAMSKVHEILHHQNVGQIEVLPYLHEILKLTLDACFDKNYQLKIGVVPTDLKLNIHTILPLGLIVNEMAINAIKHAFKDLNEGIIEISLEKIQDDYRLTFKDNGVGISEERPSELSTGLKMIKSLVLQLKGTSDIINNQGTQFTLLFKQIGI